MDLTLVILAAGKGARFGGDKPLAAVGPNSESLFEYSVHDAVKAGFNRVVFVVSPNQNTNEFSDRLASYHDQLHIEFVIQHHDAEVASNLASSVQRSRPWGTGHAVLVCRGTIDTPFVVINADDYHGAANYRLIGDYLTNTAATPDTAALPGYALGNTLSSAGGVNRGICTVGDDGILKSITEYTNITVEEDHVSWDNSSTGDDIASLDALVSMTFWGFHPEVFTVINNAFERFLQTTGNIESDEFYIPAAVDFAINSGLLHVRVFPSTQQWRGITYAGDTAAVRRFIETLPYRISK